MVVTKPLGEILVDQGVIDQAQLEQALSARHGAHRRLGETLVELGFADFGQVARALAEQYGIPFHELGDDVRLDRDDIRMVPESLARRYCLIPYHRLEGGELTVIMSDPLNTEAIDAIQRLSGCSVRPAVGSPLDILAAIDRFYREDAHIERNLREIIELEAADGVPGDDLAEMDVEQLRVVANDAPVVRYVNLILMEAVRDEASDIHFEPGENGVTVRLRTDGMLHEVTPPPKSLYPAVVTRIKIMSNMDIAERRLPLDGRFRFKADVQRIDVRVSSLPQIHGEKLVLRILNQDAVRLDFSAIGFEPDMQVRFKRILSLPNGIVLLTGPTGSGKTTTLYSALNYLKSPVKNIQTVEDPVEYQLAGINQLQIKPAIGLDFAYALRSILRQDPDIILVGEIRDLETAQIAVRASLTGHLVLSTLHTNDAPTAFSRLRDIGVQPFLIAATVRLVIAQRLVRLVCERCRSIVRPQESQLELVRAVFPDADAWTYVRGVGCRDCAGTGYRGRRGIFEFLETTPAFLRRVAEGMVDAELREQAIEDGMRTLVEDGFLRVRHGLTTIEEVLSICPMIQTGVPDPA